jgi:hypothetical protein
VARLATSGGTRRGTSAALLQEHARSNGLDLCFSPINGLPGRTATAGTHATHAGGTPCTPVSSSICGSLGQPRCLEVEPQRIASLKHPPATGGVSGGHLSHVCAFVWRRSDAAVLNRNGRRSTRPLVGGDRAVVQAGHTSPPTTAGTLTPTAGNLREAHVEACRRPPRVSSQQ